MKRFSDFFNSLTPSELDLLLSDLELPKNKAGANRIKKIVGSQITPKRPFITLSRRSVAFICTLVFIICSVSAGGFAFVSEAKEYKEAVEFFDYYNLSDEGLTRAEIKAVYRDITTSSFTYSKTAQVIEHSISADLVDGYEISQENPTPEDIEKLWELIDQSINKQKSGIYYKLDYEYLFNETLGYDAYNKTIIEKYDGNTLLWRTNITEFIADEYFEVSDGIIVTGRNSRSRLTTQKTYAYIAKLNRNGKVVWSKKLEHGFGHQCIEAVIENDDGSLAVMSRGDLKVFVFSIFSANGKETHTKQTHTGNYGIWNAVPFDNGYIVQLGSYINDQYAKLVKVDRQGNITESYSYGSEDSVYFITDIKEFGNKLYLSAYAVPKEKNTREDARFYEMEYITHYLFSLLNEGKGIPSDSKIADMVRDNYTAVLLVCEPNDGKPKDFYSVEGSLGSTLSIDRKGRLVWDVESITTAHYSPYTSSYTIGGQSYLFRYSFSKDGKLLSKEKTDEVVGFRR